jgi:two-component system LytT family response regulator
MPNFLKALIVDDEIQGRTILRNLLQQSLPEIELVGEAGSVSEAARLITVLQPEIVFLDIHMRGETGFDLLKKLPKINFDIIFTTAHDQYALKAFRFNAIDYLLKPIILDELIAAVAKVKGKNGHLFSFTKEQLQQLFTDIRDPGRVQDKISIPTSDGFIILAIKDIVYCRASSNYTEFFLAEQNPILSSYTLKQYDEMLTGQNFFRAHRSYLINLEHVKMYKKSEGGNIVMSNAHEIELSRNHRDAFLQFFKGE